MKKPLVSIITVNFNNTVITKELLDSLKLCSYPHLEIIVVDNGSKEPICNDDIIPYEKVRLIHSNKNLGFAGGNNIAISQAKGEYIMLLNNDTEVQGDFLEPLVAAMEKNEDVGICASKLLYHNTPDMIQYAGSTEMSVVTLRSRSIGYGERDCGQYGQIKPTNLAHGAAMLVRKTAINQAGLMPEEYFLYYEEIDWCMTIKSKGYEILFVPQSVVYHKESKSVGKLSTLQVYYKTRNRILLSKKWNTGVIKFLSLGYLTGVAIKDFIKFRLQNMPEHSKVIKSALLWHLSPSTDLD